MMTAAATNLPRRRLGQTDLHVSAIGLGGNKFSGSGGLTGLIAPDLSQEVVNGIVKAALDGGMNWIDSAEIYGFGRSEQAISRALKAAGRKDDDVIIATKWFPLLRTAANIGRTIDKRLEALQGYAIDLYMVHNPYGFSSPEDEMEAMADLVEAGQIRAVGVSNFSADQMRRAQLALQKRGLSLAVNQVQYSLLDRSIETNGVLATAGELGVTLIAWAPLGSGVLSGKYHQPDRLQQAPFARRLMLQRRLKRSRPLVQALTEIGQHHHATPAQVAINWVVNSQGETVVAIPGASSVRHAVENAAAMHFQLSASQLEQLERLSQPFR